jgi:Arm DNA-binding domain
MDSHRYSLLTHPCQCQASAKTVPTIRLTDLGVAHLKSQVTHVDYWDATLPTFGVRVSPKGTKTFILKLHNGRRAIGRYHLDILPLSKARAEAKRLIAEKTLGRIRPGSILYDAAVKLFIEDKKRNRRANTYEAYEWLLNRFSFGQLTYITAGDITPQVARIKSPSTAGHALIALRIFFNWTIKRQYRETNPGPVAEVVGK